VLPWLVPAAVLAALLIATGTPAGDLLLYAGYLTLAVLLPGTLVHRALRGSRGNLPEDLGLGGATGLLLLLAGWALVTATGLQALLVAWPVLIVLPFVAVPRLRRHWRIAEPSPLPPAWSWLMAGGLTLVVLSFWPVWHLTPLPPADAFWYQDLGYHLALIHEMTRSMPFQVPQLAGDTLHYTYLSDADMAAATMITRIDPAVVLLRLWAVPIAAIAALVTAALARELTGRWWAGALSGVAAVAGLPLVLGGRAAAMGGNAINYYSPSQVYMLPLAGLLLFLAVDVLRGTVSRRAWLLVFPLALACAGAKSSALPPIVAGLVAALLAVALWRRDRLRPALAFTGLVLAAMVAGIKVFAGGGASILSVEPLAILYWFTPYRKTVGAFDENSGDVFLPAGIAHASAGALVFVAALVVWWVLMQAGRLAGLAALGAGGTRRDPAAWLLGGLTAAGVGGLWLLWHPSASQNYFFVGMIPFATVLTVWLLADRVRGRRKALVYGLVAGGVWAVVVPRLGPPPRRTVLGWSLALAEPVLLTAVVIGVVIGVVLLTRRGSRRALPIALLAAVVGGSVGTFADRVADDTGRALHDPGPRPDKMISRDEMAAALWLAKHSGEDDLVATNVHCLPGGPPGECDARAFWVAGLTGRRALVESWGYTDQAVAADGVGGLRYYKQPAPYPERYALNQRVFAEGDPADVAELRDRFHVRWLFADRRSGPVSPRLARIVPERHAAGPVTIYELRPGNPPRT
jgi:hypothetical protein